MKKQNINSGSITLEAAMVVPMFIILMLLVNGLFMMFIGQQVMLHALIQSAKSLALDPYSSQRVAANAEDDLADMFIDVFSFSGEDYISTEKWYEENPEELEEIVETRFIAYLQGSATDAESLLENIGVKSGINGLDFSGCILEEGILTLRLKYTQEYIFNAMDLASFEREISVQVQLFQYN